MSRLPSGGQLWNLTLHGVQELHSDGQGNLVVRKSSGSDQVWASQTWSLSDDIDPDLLKDLFGGPDLSYGCSLSNNFVHEGKIPGEVMHVFVI